MSFREDMQDLITDYNKPDMFPEERIDRLIQGAIRDSGLTITYNAFDGEIEGEFSSKNYSVLSMFFELSALSRLHNYYIDNSFSVSDEEGSGDFKNRAILVEKKIEGIKNSKLYKEINIPFVFSSF